MTPDTSRTFFFPGRRRPPPTEAEIIQQEISDAKSDLRTQLAKSEMAEAMVVMLEKRLARLQAEAEACK